MKTIKLLSLLILIFSFSGKDIKQSDSYQNGSIIYKDNSMYLANTLVIKFNNDLNGNLYNLLSSFDFHPVLKDLKIKKIQKYFTDDKLKSKSVDLSKIYIINYENSIDPLIIAEKLKSDNNIVYSEPLFIYKVDFIPNDPNISNQYYLNKCKLPEAWDVSKGDSSVVIGIIDTGVFWTHPDLNANIWINKNEIPNNNIDDDNNGYIDDILGWDFGGSNGNPDNDPAEDQADHGTLVAGAASASTNNGIGMAGAGFKCKVMAVKTSRNDFRDPSTGKPYIIYGYEGIKYAADNGAKIINCSWGGGGYSLLGQETINYATEKGALVIAAAGNNNSATDHYPSNYDNCFSVAATDENDVKASFSNYNFSVDVSAPGTNFYSTWYLNTYGYVNGTSLSAPLVSGIAGLVAAHFPSYTPEQLAEKIRVSSDNIYSLNPNYLYKLGKGRVNAQRALNTIDNKSVRGNNFTLNDNPPLGNGNGILEPNESADIIINFKNILSQTNALNITLSSLTSGVNIVNSSFNPGAVASGQSFNNSNSPFRISASTSLSSDILIQLLLNYSDGSYSDFQAISFIANPTYIQANNEQIDVTICSQGNLAFNDFPTNTKGKGLKYKNSQNLLFEGSLIIGTSATKISDRARGNDGNTQNQDFKVVQPIKLFKPGNKSDIQTLSIFNDDNAGVNKLGIKTILNTYQFSEDPNTDYILLHYSFINLSNANISNFYAGLFLDWDLIAATGLDDRALWDNEAKFGYVYNVNRTVPYYLGCGLVSDNKYNYRAILNAGGDGSWGIYDGFTDAEKWEAISGGLTKISAGAGDVSHVISAGPYNLNMNDTLHIVFAIAGGDSLLDLKNHFLLAKNKWYQISTNINEYQTQNLQFELSQNYPNPFNPSTTIHFSIPQSGLVQLNIYDHLGRKIETLINENKEKGRYSVLWNAEKFTSGIYYYELRVINNNQVYFNSVKKMIILK